MHVTATLACRPSAGAGKARTWCSPPQSPDVNPAASSPAVPWCPSATPSSQSRPHTSPGSENPCLSGCAEPNPRRASHLAPTARGPCRACLVPASEPRPLYLSRKTRTLASTSSPDPVQVSPGSPDPALPKHRLDSASPPAACPPLTNSYVAQALASYRPAQVPWGPGKPPRSPGLLCLAAAYRPPPDVFCLPNSLQPV